MDRRGGGARTVACITSASDAHTTDALAGNFYEAMAMAEHFGFRQGRHPEDFWTR
jgi:histidinol-phosphatase (PHP family)